MEHYQGEILRDRYRLTHKIGQGGMAAVYLADDVTLGGTLTVAIKQNIYSASPEENLLFEQEAHVLVSLRTDPDRPRSLPTILEYFNEPNAGQQVQYLVMDYIKGEDLDSMLQRAGHLDEQITLFWLEQIMEGLEFLHNQSTPIIHRDLKPSNIRISKDGKIAYLVDFGLAGAAGQKLGTDGFAPPEQYQGKTDIRSDIYALGATLYALLSGETPPPSTDLLAKTITLSPPDHKVSISALVRDVILQAMELKPSNRYQTIAEMRQALQPELPTKQPALGALQPKIQQPIQLNPPPLLKPQQTGAWWAEPQAQTFRIVLTANHQLISGGSSGLIKFWSIAANWDKSGRLVGRGKHQDWVSCLALSRDSQLVASGSWDRTISVWDIQHRRSIGPPLTIHKDIISALAFSPDRQWLISAGHDKTVWCWSLLKAGDEPTLLAEDVLATGLAFSPDGQWLAAACRLELDRPQSRRQGGKVWLWNMSTQTEVILPAEISDHAGPVFAVAFSPDGSLLAAGGEDRFIHLAETRDQKLQTALEPEVWRRRYVVGQHPGTIYCLAFSPDNRLLVTGGADRMVQIWDVANNQLAGAYGPFAAEILSVTFGLYWQLLVVATKNGAVSLVRLG